MLRGIYCTKVLARGTRRWRYSGHRMWLILEILEKVELCSKQVTLQDWSILVGMHFEGDHALRKITSLLCVYLILSSSST
jgi:hypothetical protein